MRIAILIVGLMVWFIALMQTLIVGGLSDYVNDEGTETAASIGTAGLFVWLGALVIVIPWPRAAMWLFLAAGGIMFLGAGEFPDLGVWGAVAVAFGVLSYFGLRQKRKKDAKELERDEMFAQMVAHQQTMATVMTAPIASAPSEVPATSDGGSFAACASCGKAFRTDQPFCPWCGKSRDPIQIDAEN